MVGAIVVPASAGIRCSSSGCSAPAAASADARSSPAAYESPSSTRSMPSTSGCGTGVGSPLPTRASTSPRCGTALSPTVGVLPCPASPTAVTRAG